ncbi:MAG: lytic transglycosylase domain-containing protein [Betaproteobacteria bacterium]|jgi:soluble lytic murein transglycosylase-like protein|uniref:Lytic transglycosylase domain-containing protein n=1 Tax=Candidatus Proximibacter danicus TaxID=2954365 RepID=A0A9D7K4V7_9PROT|nr:lytic transglycosylase domain-containing protein [Candidatus Proximibacter danicus]MBK9445826.1 lytic transglycosylase domain-containing protein [Betaproteobacteria bacterium]
MSATIILKPTMLRATSAMASLVQAILMAAGVLLLAGLFAFYQGDRRVVAQLQSLLSEQMAAVARDGNPIDAPAVTVGASLQGSVDSLTPRMRTALEYVSRRYRVSMGALEPIFVAAESAGRDLRLDPLLIVSVIAIESRFNPLSESVVGAQGLMQVIPRFHQDKLPDGADELSFFDPVLNVHIGSRILKESIHRNGGLINGLQQYAGASDDAEQRYAAKVLAEKNRLEAVVQRLPLREA